MKNIFLTDATFATAFAQNGFAHANIKFQILQSYYKIKNALVAVNAVASTKAAVFEKLLNVAETNIDSSLQRVLLSKSLLYITENKNLTSQRVYFEKYSTDLFKLEESFSLTDKALYYAYFPLKKKRVCSVILPLPEIYFSAAPC